MIEKLRLLREKAKVAENQMVELQSEIDEIERGVLEVPWYEEEWLLYEYGKDDDISLGVTIRNGDNLAAGMSAGMARRVQFMPKLVKAVREHVADFADTSPGHPAMIEALRKMGEEV